MKNNIHYKYLVYYQIKDGLYNFHVEGWLHNLDDVLRVSHCIGEVWIVKKIQVKEYE